MDIGDIANQVQDLGLAQTINAGLQKGMSKEPAWPNPEELASAKESYKSKDPMTVFNSPIGKKCMVAWSEATGTSLSSTRRKSTRRASGSELRKASITPPSAEALAVHWPTFTESKEYEIYCKYMFVASKKVNPNKEMFHEMRALGKGAFGAVFLVFKKDSGHPFATKKMMKKIAKKNKMLKDVQVERDVLEKVNSPFLVNLHYSWQDDTHWGLVLSLCPGGDLSFVMSQLYQKDKNGKKTGEYQKMPKKQLQFYAASMALGLEALHGAKYVYRDLKPQNVLINLDGQVKISDMGLAHSIAGGAIKQKSGTRGYWSPETIQGEKYTTEPDWWSLGVTMFVLFSDKMPFKGKTDEETDNQTCTKTLDFKHDEPEDLKTIIGALCTVDTSARLGCEGAGGMAALKSHAYFQGFEWAALIAGNMTAPFVPDPNDINAPSEKDIGTFEAPKDVNWGADDQAQFAGWNFAHPSLSEEEFAWRLEKKKDLTGGDGGGGGGGCCVIA